MGSTCSNPKWYWGSDCNNVFYLFFCVTIGRFSDIWDATESEYKFNDIEQSKAEAKKQYVSTHTFLLYVVPYICLFLLFCNSLMNSISCIDYISFLCVFVNF